MTEYTPRLSFGAEIVSLAITRSAVYRRFLCLDDRWTLPRAINIARAYPRTRTLHYKRGGVVIHTVYFSSVACFTSSAAVPFPYRYGPCRSCTTVVPCNQYAASSKYFINSGTPCRYWTRTTKHVRYRLRRLCVHSAEKHPLMLARNTLRSR